MAKLTLGRRIASVFFPERCVCCDTVIPPGEGTCAACGAELPRIGSPVCPFCGMEKNRCSCHRRRHPYERAVAPFYYEGNLAAAVLRFKQSGDAGAAAWFGEQMADTVARYYDDISFDGVTFVPSFPKKERERGFNPGRLMAEAAAKALGLPLLPLLVKITDTPPQKSLSAPERSGNVLGVFDLAEGAEVAGKNLLLADDTLTTGATLNECAKMLKIYGAEAVYVVAAAITAADRDREQKERESR